MERGREKHAYTYRESPSRSKTLTHGCQMQRYTYNTSADQLSWTVSKSRGRHEDLAGNRTQAVHRKVMTCATPHESIPSHLRNEGVDLVDITQTNLGCPAEGGKDAMGWALAIANSRSIEKQEEVVMMIAMTVIFAFLENVGEQAENAWRR